MRLIDGAKKSFITRNVDFSLVESLLEDQAPKRGDLLLAQVERIRQHTRLEDVHGRRVHLYPGDEVIVAAGGRYASDQFEAEAPEALGPCHLVAAGGLAAVVKQRHARIKPATEITLLGVLGGRVGDAINLSRFAPLQRYPVGQVDLPVLLVIGSDMNAGKTTTAAACIFGLRQLGLRVAGGKLTGTGAGPDYWRMKDAGAISVTDFLDAGLPSTVGVAADELVGLLRRFKASAQDACADLLVVEVADGVLQPETAALLRNSSFIQEITGAIVASDSAVAALMITQGLLVAGINVLGISGLLTNSPLASEEVRRNTGLPVLNLNDLMDQSVLEYLGGELCETTFDSTCPV